MNSVTLIGRVCKEIDVRTTQGAKPLTIARYSLAVDRAFKQDGQPTADFINCIAFGKNATFAEKYLKKGTKIAIQGHIQTGSYTNKDGLKVYTTDVVVERHEFVESKSASQSNAQSAPTQDNFVSVPDAIDEALPFA